MPSSQQALAPVACKARSSFDATPTIPSRAIYKKASAVPNASTAKVPTREASTEAAEAAADGRHAPAPGSVEASFTGRPSPRSKLDVLHHLQGGIKNGLNGGIRAGTKHTHLPHQRAASEESSGVERPGPSDAQDAPTARCLFDAPASPHPLLRKDSQQPSSTVERSRRSLRTSVSQRSHRSPRPTDPSDGAHGGLEDAFGSCPASPPVHDGMAGAKARAAANAAAAARAGGHDGSPGGNCMSLEPWLVAGVVEEREGPDGTKALARGKGSGKRRSSGVGAASPSSAAQHTPGRSPSLQQRVEGGRGRESSHGGGVPERGTAGAVREGAHDGAGHHLQAGSNFSAILRRKPPPKPARPLQRSKSKDGPRSPSPPPAAAASPSPATAPILRKPPPLLLQQGQQRPRNPGPTSSCGSTGPPSARMSLDLHPRPSEGDRASTASTARRVHKGSAATAPLATTPAAGVGHVGCGGTRRPAEAEAEGSSNPGSALATPSTTAHPSPDPPAQHHPAAPGGPSPPTIFSGAFGEAARETARAGDSRGGGDSGGGGRSSSGGTRAGVDTPAPPASCPHGDSNDSAAVQLDHLDANPLFCEHPAQRPPLPPPQQGLVRLLQEGEAGRLPPKALEQSPAPAQHARRPSSRSTSPRPTQQRAVPGRESKPLSPGTSPQGSSRPTTESARTRRQKRAAEILAARKQAESPPADSRAPSHRPGAGTGGVGRDPEEPEPGKRDALAQHRKSLALSLPSLSGRYSEEGRAGSEAESKDTGQVDSGDEEGVGQVPAFNPLYGLPQIQRAASMRHGALRRLESAALAPGAGYGPRAARRTTHSKTPTPSHSPTGDAGGQGAPRAPKRAAPESWRAEPTPRVRTPSAPAGYAARLVQRNERLQQERAGKARKGPRYAASTEAYIGKKAPASRPSTKGHPLVEFPGFTRRPPSCLPSRGSRLTHGSAPVSQELYMVGEPGLLETYLADELGDEPGAPPHLLAVDQTGNALLPLGRKQVSFSGLGLPPSPPPRNRSMSMLVQEILQERDLEDAANSITPEVLAQLGLTPLESRTTHHASTSALAALRAVPVERRASLGLELERRPALQASSAGQLPRLMQRAGTQDRSLFSRSQDSLDRAGSRTQAGYTSLTSPPHERTSITQHLIRLRSARGSITPQEAAAALAALETASSSSVDGIVPSRLGKRTSSCFAAGDPGSNAEILRSTSLPACHSAKHQAPRTPRKSGDASSSACGGSGTPPRLLYSTSQNQSRGSSHGGHANDSLLQQSGSGRLSGGSHSLPPLSPHMSRGPDAPGSYTSRLRAAKAMQGGSMPHRLSPCGSNPTPTHRRVLSLPVWAEGLPDLGPDAAAGTAAAAAGARLAMEPDARVLGHSWAGSPLMGASRHGGNSMRSSRDGSEQMQEDHGASTHQPGEEGSPAFGKEGLPTSRPCTLQSSPSKRDWAAAGGTGARPSSEAGADPAAAQGAEAEEGEGKGGQEEGEAGAEEAGPALGSTPEGQQLLQMVPHADYTVEAALVDVRGGVRGRVKGGLLQQLEEAEREQAAAQEADKAAGLCSCFGPPKPAKKPPSKLLPPQQQQQLQFVASDEQVTLVERARPGGPEKVHTLQHLAYALPWSKDGTVTLECGSMPAEAGSSKVAFTTASSADFARVVLGLNAALLHRRKEYGGSAAELSTPVRDLPWFA